MWPTDAAWPLVFASGLAGGLGHCAGMCGPLVAALAVGASGGRPSLANLLFNLGRVTTYGILGGAVGLAGSFVGVAARLEGLQNAVAAGTGVVVAVLGLSAAGLLPGRRRRAPDRPVPAPLSWAARLVTAGPGPGSLYPLGLAAGFLPCGLVYAALLAASREGMVAGAPAAGALRGLALMLVFGAGTAPPLFLVGRAAASLNAPLRASLSRAAGLAMVAAGALLAARGLAH